MRKLGSSEVAWIGHNLVAVADKPTTEVEAYVIEFVKDSSSFAEGASSEVGSFLN